MIYEAKLVERLRGNKRTYLIAEIGINHNGCKETLKELIKAAKESGADAVKLQKRTIDAVYSSSYLEEPRQSPFGSTQRCLKERLELSDEAYSDAKRLSEELGMDFFFSPWDEASVRFGEEMKFVAYKIASPCVHDLELLKELAKTKKVMFLSVGMSDELRIRQALEILSDCPVVLLHCVSSYPCPDEKVNLSRMDLLRQHFPGQLAYGYSGHENGILPSLLAVAKGASVIERHFTLDKKMWGSDQAISLDPESFKELVIQVRQVELILGDRAVGLRVMPHEIPAMKKLQRNRKVNLVVLDIDGVITDGKVSLGPDGEELKSIGYRELDGIRSLINSGYKVSILSKESNETLVKRLSRLEIDQFVTGCADKVSAMKDLAAKAKESLENVCYIGDSISDLGVLSIVGLGMCPIDAIPQVKERSKLVLSSLAGTGVVAEAHFLLERINSIRSFKLSDMDLTKLSQELRQMNVEEAA